MTREEKFIYLNNKLSRAEMYEGPKYLYKYRPFDEHTFDMLENDYLYLCPAYDLDDKSECVTTVDVNKLLNVDSGSLQLECVNQIINFIKPYANSDGFERTKSLIYSAIDKYGKVDNRLILEVVPELQELVHGYDISLLVNEIVNIPEMLGNEHVKNRILPLIELGLAARDETGVCSLAESCDIENMWTNYATNSSGYCVEYMIDNYEFNKDILPVIYEDNKEQDVLVQLVGSFMGFLIETMTNGLIQTDKSHFIRLLLTKALEWEYQREWRLIGYAGDKPKAPCINRIIVGKNILDDNLERLSACAKRLNIEICRQKDRD